MNTQTNGQVNAIVLMRLLIGWHFLYEGAMKLYNPSWTAKGYLLSAEGWFKPFFGWIASDGLIAIIDYANMLGLLIVGLTLLLGYLEKIGSGVGIVLLILFYLAHPALPGFTQLGTEGNYWIVNKNLIEAAALLVIYCIPTSKYFGLERLFTANANPATSSN